MAKRSFVASAEQQGTHSMSSEQQQAGPAGGPSPQEALKQATIVVVDDEPTTLDMIEMFLQAEGYENVVTVSESTQALDTIYTKRADLVLLDLMMPEIGGLEILRTLREHSELGSIPVVVFSSTSDREVKLEALELGATEFLAKPVDPSELALRVRNTLAYKAYQERFGQIAGDGSQGFMERMSRALRGAAPSVRSRLAGEPRYRATIEKFVTRLDEKLEWMEARFEAEQYEELAALAHWLKGSATMVGFDAFAGPADTLEILAKEGKRDEAGAVLRELHSLTERIVFTNDEDA
jgi:CheY-like chemotaxis protein